MSIHHTSLDDPISTAHKQILLPIGHDVLLIIFRTLIISIAFSNSSTLGDTLNVVSHRPMLVAILAFLLYMVGNVRLMEQIALTTPTRHHDWLLGISFSLYGKPTLLYYPMPLVSGLIHSSITLK